MLSSATMARQAGRQYCQPLFRQNGLPARQYPAILSPKSSAGRSLRACHHDALLSLRGAHDISAEAFEYERHSRGLPPAPPFFFFACGAGGLCYSSGLVSVS